MSETALSVLVQEAHLNRFAEIVQSCRNAGMVVQREMSSVGVISGTIDSSDVPKLRHIDGLQQIEPSRTLHSLDTPPTS
jgi:hypothetical protein